MLRTSARNARARVRDYLAYRQSATAEALRSPLRAVVLNRVGSERHAALVRREIEAATGLPVLGALPKHAAIEIPERHLGLIPSQQQARALEVIDRLAELAEQHLDLGGLVALAGRAPALAADTTSPFPSRYPNRAFGSRYGAFDIDSMPPVTTSSCPPARIMRSAISSARMDDAHTLLIVSAGTSFAIPAPIAA